MIDVQIQGESCYTLSMIQEAREKRDEKVSAKIPSTVKTRILELAGEHDRTESYVVLALIERGLAANHRDGLLKEPLTQAERPKTIIAERIESYKPNQKNNKKRA